MARKPSSFFCTSCGNEASQWAGRCGACGEWNSMAAAPRPSPEGAGQAPAGPVVARSLADFDAADAQPVATGIGELDRVLAGGLVRGSTTLLGGEPGVGKSTLVLQLLGTAKGLATLVSAEESAAQVRARAERIKVEPGGIQVVASGALSDAVAAVETSGLVVVDSIQTVADPSISSAAGSVAQVTRGALLLSERARACGTSLVLVGHVTKEGALAGPRVLEHLVDTVLTFEGDPARQLRMLRAVKHRYGPTGELGLFEMEPGGLVGVEPGARFIGERSPDIGGSAVAAAVDGHRTLMVEVQSLVVPLQGNEAVPRWAAQGVDSRRMSLLAAVLDRRCGLSLGRCDVYASVTGGARLSDPGADLPLCLALGSARLDRALPAGVAAFGEVGLGGEIRPVGRAAQRVGEAARLGFRSVLVPSAEASGLARVGGTEVVPVASLAEALCIVGLTKHQRAA
jgi:DNA repair protein RadA/Sms